MNKKTRIVGILTAIALTICTATFLIWLVLFIRDEIMIPNSEEGIYNELRTTVKEDVISNKNSLSIHSNFIIDDEHFNNSSSNDYNDDSDSVINDYSYTPSQTSYETNVINIEDNSLREINKDIVGWIAIPNTPIDYPIMQSDDNNEYYLYHNYKHEETKYGSIVMDFRCNKDSENLIVYGHNMMAGNMFAYLKKYEQFCTFQNNPYIYVKAFGENRVYQIFSVFRTATDGDGYFNYCRPDFDIPEEYTNFINTISSMSIYDTGVKATGKDEIICLSTCTAAYGNLRTVVAAKRVK